jgi:hypothetical protein
MLVRGVLVAALAVAAAGRRDARHTAKPAPRAPGSSPRNREARVPTGAVAHDPALQFQVAGARPDQVKQRPSLINYNPVAAPAAVVTSSDGLARFTVLTPRVIRMEQSRNPNVFEDHSTIAILNRNLPVPPFTSSVNAGVLTIATASVRPAASRDRSGGGMGGGGQSAE